jgi:hypothetical protein
MRERRFALFILLVSTLTFLTSLFLPWRQMHVAGGNGSFGLPGAFSDDGFDGWIGGVGDVAVLLAVASVFACLGALVRPRLAEKLPLGGLGVGLGYLAAAVAVQVHAYTVLIEVGIRTNPRSSARSASHVHSVWAYGFYLGVVCGAVAGRFADFSCADVSCWSGGPRPTSSSGRSASDCSSPSSCRGRGKNLCPA